MNQEVNPYRLFYHSPVGWLNIEASETGITAVWFCDEKTLKDNPNPLVLEAKKQLEAYFSKELKTFDLPLEMKGTDFQKHVWTALLDIPYGVTISYLELSKRIGDVKAIRAVGHANGQNPLPIIIPCHRVIGSDGSLTGYGGGLWRKKKLLQLEGLLPQMELEF